MQAELLKRAADLIDQCQSRNIVTTTGFLSPAECSELKRSHLYRLHLSGGDPACMRKAAFFLPEYIEPEYFSDEEYICAIQCSTKFAQPSHRDYMGALLGLGLERKCIGDIFVDGDTAVFFCLKNISQFILQNLTHIGSCGVKAKEIPLCEVTLPEIATKDISFTVAAPRLDAVCAGMFSISRGKAADMISSGLVTLNYQEILKPDAKIGEGDILSIRGKGKGEICSLGTPTRKGRLPVNARIYV